MVVWLGCLHCYLQTLLVLVSLVPLKTLLERSMGGSEGSVFLGSRGNSVCVLLDPRDGHGTEDVDILVRVEVFTLLKIVHRKLTINIYKEFEVYVYY